MNIDDYQTGASTTADYPGRGFGPLGLAYTATGLISEVGEWSDAVMQATGNDNIIRELGDVYWYFSQTCLEIGVKPSDALAARTFNEVTVTTYPFEVAQNIATRACFRLADQVKKHIRDDMDGITDIRASAIAWQVGEIMVAVIGHANLLRLDVNEVARINLAKLADRKERGVIHGTGGHR